MARKTSEEKQSKWKEIILKQSQSNLSIVSWCSQNNIAVPTFCYWRNKLFPKPSLNRYAFTEIAQGNNDVRSGISLEYHGIKVHLEREFEPTVLQACLQVLKQC